MQMKQTQKCQCIALACLESQQQLRIGSIRYNNNRALSETWGTSASSASTSRNNSHSSYLKKMRARAWAKVLLDSDLLK